MAAKENQINFTKAALQGIQPGERRAYVYDTRTRGLTLRIEPTGQKAFYLYRRVDGRPRMIKLGLFPDMSIENARTKAQEMNVAIANDENPTSTAQKAREEWTFGRLGGWWVEYAKTKKKSWKLDEWMLEAYFAPLKNHRLSSVAKADIRRLHADIGQQHGNYAANRAMEMARAMFNRAINHDLYDGVNPTAGLEWNKQKSRDRRLLAGEVKAFFDALEAEPSELMRDFVVISLFSGARQANVCQMRWDEIDFVGATWRIPETKNGEPQTIPLGVDEVAILKRRKIGFESPWVFATRSSTGHMTEPRMGWERIRTRAKLPDLRMHDLRRSLGSWMAGTGASLHLIGKTLGHLSNESTRIYAHYEMDSIREAKNKAIGAMKQARGSE